MKKRELTQKVDNRISTTKDALQLLWDSITAQGQKKKALKDEQVKELFDFYGVDTGGL